MLKRKRKKCQWAKKNKLSFTYNWIKLMKLVKFPLAAAFPPPFLPSLFTHAIPIPSVNSISLLFISFLLFFVVWSEEHCRDKYGLVSHFGPIVSLPLRYSIMHSWLHQFRSSGASAPVCEGLSVLGVFLCVRWVRWLQVSTTVWCQSLLQGDDGKELRLSHFRLMYWATCRSHVQVTFHHITRIKK